MAAIVPAAGDERVLHFARVAAGLAARAASIEEGPQADWLLLAEYRRCVSTQEPQEVLRLPEPVIFNCAGLGARALFGDQKLGPVRGQLEVLLPQAGIDYCYLGSGYMFPRRDGIMLGGTFDYDDWSLEPKPEQTTEILEAHAGIMKGMKR